MYGCYLGPQGQALPGPPPGGQENAGRPFVFLRVGFGSRRQDCVVMQDTPAQSGALIPLRTAIPDCGFSCCAAKSRTCATRVVQPGDCATYSVPATGPENPGESAPGASLASQVARRGNAPGCRVKAPTGNRPDTPPGGQPGFKGRTCTKAAQACTTTERSLTVLHRLGAFVATGADAGPLYTSLPYTSHT